MTGAGGAGGTDGAAGRLERGYRRLLACYPPRHRREHGEEMLGVLLAAAPDEQRRPRLRETADLLRGAARIWLAPHGSRTADAGWRDAFAIVSVALPLVMGLKAVAETAAFEAAISPERIYASLTGDLVSRSPLSPGLVILLVLLRLRRTAAVVTLVFTVELLVASITGVIHGMAVTDFGSVVAFAMLGYAVETAALAFSAGPRRGVRLLTWRGTAAVVTGTLAAAACAATVTAAKAPVISLPGMVMHQQEASPALLSALASASAVVVLAIAAAVARSGPGRRVLLLLAIPGWVLPAGLLQPWPGPGTAALLTFLPPVVLAALAIAVARRSGRTGPAGGEPGGMPG